jgi:RimJ/RimL family protein N-acetyltransferase
MREEIEGEKIILRRYKTSFAPLLYEAAFESRGGEFSRWMRWCQENYSLADSESFVEKCVKNREQDTEFNFAIFDRLDGVFLGGVGLNQFNRQHNFVNLGYWIRTSRQNRGAASDATVGASGF